jgi:hypothetical protein
MKGWKAILRLRRAGQRSDRTRSLDGTDFKRAMPARIIPFPQRSDPDMQPLWSAKEAARFLSINEKTLRRYAGAGKIPGFRLDDSDPKSEWRFDSGVLAAFTKTRCWKNLKEPGRSEIHQELAKIQSAQLMTKPTSPSPATLNTPIPRANSG